MMMNAGIAIDHAEEDQRFCENAAPSAESVITLNFNIARSAHSAAPRQECADREGPCCARRAARCASYQTCLRTVAYQDEQECDFHQERVERAAAAKSISQVTNAPAAALETAAKNSSVEETSSNPMELMIRYFQAASIAVVCCKN